MKKSKIIPYGRQWIDEGDIKEVAKVLKSDWITQGPNIDEFERKIAEYSGAKYAVAVSSGTAALHVAYMAAGIGEGDEIITTPLTFAATSNMAVKCGAKPIFADIDESTLNIDIKKIEEKITPKTKAIVVVDFAGQPCDLDEIGELARKHNLLFIEDAAHALGSEYKGKKVGGMANLTIFSFHPVKLITTGEGGMVLTNSKDLYDKMRSLRHHGAVKRPEIGGWYYDIEEPGYNFRITDLQCALGLSQFKKIGKFIKRRRDIVKKYNTAFKNIPQIIIPSEKEYVKSAWHIYPVQFRSEKLKMGRKEIFALLHENNIKVQVHYLPVHLHPFYKNKFGYKEGDFPKAERYYGQAISLPLFPAMTDKDVKAVIETVKKIINSIKR